MWEWDANNQGAGNNGPCSASYGRVQFVNSSHLRSNMVLLAIYSGQGEQVLQGSQWMDCSKKHRRRRCGPALTLAVAAEPRRGDRLACPCLCLCPRPCLLPGVSCRPFASCLGPLAQSRPPAASQAHHQLHRHYPRRHQAPPSALECSPYWLPRHPRADCGKPPFRELIKTRGRASETLPLVNR